MMQQPLMRYIGSLKLGLIRLENDIWSTNFIIRGGTKWKRIILKSINQSSLKTKNKITK